MGSPIHSNQPEAVHRRHQRRLGFEKSHHPVGGPGTTAVGGGGGGGSSGGGMAGGESAGLLPQPQQAASGPTWADIALHPFGDVEGDWAPGSWTGGDPVDAGYETWRLEEVEAWHEEGAEQTLSASTSWGIASYVGAASASSSSPLSMCEAPYVTYAGRRDVSRVASAHVGAHPEGAAGVAFDVSGDAWNVHPRTGVVTVSDVQPETARSGTVVAVVPLDGETYEVYVPIDLVPAEGGTLWIQLSPGWSADRGAFACGFSWPYETGAFGSGRGTFGLGSAPFWLLWDGDPAASPVGVTVEQLEPELGGPPFDGGVPLMLSGVSGLPYAYGVEDGLLYLTADSPAGVRFRYEEDGQEVPWDGPWAYRAIFMFDVASDAEEPGERAIRFTSGQHEAIVHLGDGSRPAGLSLVTGAETRYVPLELEPMVGYAILVDSRSETELRAKVWEGIGPEPLRWTLRAGVGEEAEEGALAITLSAGNGATDPDQTVFVHPPEAAVTAEEGQWVDDALGFGDGETDRVFTSLRSVPASLALRVDGLWVQVAGAVPDDGMVRTDAPPASGAPLAARYQVASEAAAAEDEAEDLEGESDEGEEGETDA